MPGITGLIDQIVVERLQALANAKAPESLWTVDDVARYLNVSTRTVENLIAEGSLIPLRVRNARRFDPAAVRAYLESTSR